MSSSYASLTRRDTITEPDTPPRQDSLKKAQSGEQKTHRNSPKGAALLKAFRLRCRVSGNIIIRARGWIGPLKSLGLYLERPHDKLVAHRWLPGGRFRYSDMKEAAAAAEAYVI
jgi:hypothetical protein